MAKFLFIYRESTESHAQPSPEEMQAAHAGSSEDDHFQCKTQPSPEELQALQAAWFAWMQKYSSAILPGGDGLKPTGRVLKSGLVTDGPYVEAKEVVVSFGVMQAEDYDAALEIARACPPGHTIEIREFAGYA